MTNVSEWNKYKTGIFRSALLRQVSILIFLIVLLSGNVGIARQYFEKDNDILGAVRKLTPQSKSKRVFSYTQYTQDLCEATPFNA